MSHRLKRIHGYLKDKKVYGNISFILFFILLRISVFGNYEVPTGSMKPTILEGDRFFANKLAYNIKVPFTKTDLSRWGLPARGEIIAFLYPNDESLLYTKRVIGIPGDRIEIRDKSLYINGKKMERAVIKKSRGIALYRETLDGTSYNIQVTDYISPYDNMEKIIVPENSLFVMGDNRDNSSDSRFWGFVPMENVIGKIVFRWMSSDPTDHTLRPERIGFVR